MSHSISSPSISQPSISPSSISPSSISPSKSPSRSPSRSLSRSLSSSSSFKNIKSIGSISTLASRDSVLPEYEKLQNSLNRKVLSGRHPKSFKISSELSSQCKLSNDRVNRISKGHNIWSVIDEQSNNNSNTTHNTNYHKHDDIGYQSTRVRIKQYIIDLSNDSELSYGSDVIIITSMDEILCVDKNDCIRCKEVDDLLHDDRVVFRILNFNDITSPEKFTYGNKFWLQVISDDTVGDHSEINFHDGSVLCAKVFDSPNMTSLVSNKSDSDIDNKQKSTSNNHLKKNSPYICGGLTCMKTVETRTTITEIKTEDLFASLFGSVGTQDEIYKTGMSKETKSFTFYKSKAAQSLGVWKAHTAMNNIECEGDVIKSLSPIYMSQDLYCFATSHGAGYKPWPSSLKSDQNENIMSIVEYNQSEDIDDKILLDFNPYQHAHHEEAAEGSKRVEVSNENIFGCLRKTVIRDKTYSNVIDRRCVWRFCSIENARINTAGNTDKRIDETHDIIDTAKSMLKISEETRKGLRRTYDDHKIHGRPLPGGEAFSHNIRLIKSDFALLNTTYYALQTRQKESNARSFYERKLLNQIYSENENDRHHDSDTVSNISFSQYSADDYFDDRSINSEDNSLGAQLVSPIVHANSDSMTSILQNDAIDTIKDRKTLDSRLERAIKQPDALKSPGESMIALHQQLEAMSQKASKFVKAEIETKLLIEKGLYVPKDTVIRSKADVLDPLAIERKMNAFKAADALMFDAILHKERDDQTKKVSDLFQQIK